MQSERLDFSQEMAQIIVRNYSMKPASLPVVAKWKDWDELFALGFRKETSGEAYQEWLRNQ